MSNISLAGITAIRSYVVDWGSSDAEIMAILNAPSIPNPVPRPMVLKSYGFADVMGLLSPGSIANIRGLATGTDLINKINSQDRPGLAHWVSALMAPPALITIDEAQAVMEVLQATEPDPNWTVQISWAESLLGRLVDVEDVAASRPGA